MSEVTLPNGRILQGDCRETLKSLPDQSVHCCVTSPPYYALRDYGCDGQIGLEDSMEAFISEMVGVFREVWRVLRDDGVLWVNMGDKHEKKQLLGMPWKLAFALQDDGWMLRMDNIWYKPNPMRESATDRCCKAHEYLFQFSKQHKYWFDEESIKVPSKDKTFTVNTTPRKGVGVESTGEKVNLWMEKNGGRYHPAMAKKLSVWEIATEGYSGAHFACFPRKLVEPCILAGCPEVCCSECGAGHVRILEKVRRPTRPGEKTKVKMPDGWDTGEGGHGSFHRNGREAGQYRDTAEVGNRDPERHVTETITTGWKPSCECNAGTAKGIVLDPFGGSGTTGEVAKDLGREFVLCELNPEYVELMKKRLEQGALC